MSMFQRVISRYTQRLQSHPLSTLMVTNGALAVISDALAQQISKTPNPAPPEKDGFINTEAATSQNEYNFARTARLSFYGFATAPLFNAWYTFLDKRFPMPTGQTTTVGKYGLKNPAVRALIKRVATDQILFAPFAIALFFVSISLLEGASMEGIKTKFEKAYVPGLLGNYQLWPLAQLVNFFYVPLSLRVPFSSTVGIFWNSYLSWLNSKNPVAHSRMIQREAASEEPL
ncbi:hypothetical protein K493DRAFT_79694 [Basidiobolus meristosporus CBS 931.73]|uniref:Integral membrane protein, Mpv17/PMP22 family n=1 Tax=Basidiobolus meristosporus CBS 931.73 TaxID=1314790 RepID=A0A1Y1YXG4_9FUNG|nr:hypothetical protein K493DRAFT_79694 [Basidiobolus meristosporus CBS 931.73]|eukprot:ORY02721.1 hypothetical protein K493DRAFT_79694 [Basidiobolus meristosporus CBS 931.73]